MTQTIMFPELAARDEATSRVVANAGTDWRELADELVRSLTGDEVIGKSIRLACERDDIRPHHHNAWGGLIQCLVREGVLVPTGEYRAMKAKGSHARKTAVYRVT